MNSIGLIETFRQDLRYGLRALRKSPGGLLASYFPGRRPTKVDPMVALRDE